MNLTSKIKEIIKQGNQVVQGPRRNIIIILEPKEKNSEIDFYIFQDGISTF